MDQVSPGLEFENPIYELEARIEKLKSVGRPESEEEIRRVRDQLADVTRDI